MAALRLLTSTPLSDRLERHFLTFTLDLIRRCSMLVCPKFNYNGGPDATINPQGSGTKVMGKVNGAEKVGAVEVAEVKTVEAVAAPVMTVVKPDAPEEPRRLTLDERIQRVEDLTMLIDRWRTLSESRRKLQTFNIGADSMSSVIMLKDAAGNEFKTSNSAVIASVIDEMKRTLDGKVREIESQINL